MINEGAYLIVSAKNTTLAMDVYNGSDEAGANVWLIAHTDESYGGTNRDSQIAYVRNAKGHQTITFPLTGKCLEDSGEEVTEYHSTNARTWDCTGADGQLFDIVADGGSCTVTGRAPGTFPTYTIERADSESPRWVAESQDGGSSGGTNVQFYSKWGSSSPDNFLAQRWAFVPVPVLKDGVYSIRPAKDIRLVMGVKGASTANGANVEIVADDDENAQKWQVKTDASGTTYLKNINSGKVLDMPGTEEDAETYANLQQYDADWANDQQWLMTGFGYIKSNGTYVPTFIMHNKAQTGFVADCANGGRTIGTNVWLYPKWPDTDLTNLMAQLWEFRDTSIHNGSLSSPSDMSMALKVGGELRRTVYATGSTDTYPCFTANTSSLQGRYRVRRRPAGGAWGSWGNWKSLGDKSQSNSGWGAVGHPNFAYEVKDGRCYAGPLTCVVSHNGYDAVQIQYQVRCIGMDPEYGVPCHSSHATGTYTVYYAPSYTSEGITWSPEGLMLKHHSNLHRNGNCATVYKVTSLTNNDVLFESKNGLALDGLAWSDTAIIPMSIMQRVPAENESLKVTMRYETEDGARRYSKFSYTGALSYETGKGLAITVNASIDEQMMIRATVSGQTSWDSIDAYLVSDNWRHMEKISAESPTFCVPAPFGSSPTLWVVARKGVNWDVWHDSFNVSEANYYAFNWQRDGVDRWARIMLNADTPPTDKRTTTPDFTASLTNGGSWEHAFFGNGCTQERTIEGVIFPAIDGYSVSDLDDLVQEGHWAWLRDPRGGIARVAVTSLTVDDTGLKMKGWSEVSVTCRRVDSWAL